MRLKIKARPKDKSEYLIGALANWEVIDMDTGTDLVGKLKSIEISILRDDVATAKLEYYVEEIDIEGVGFMVEKIKEHADEE